jgi:hypothetical protein
MKFFQLFRKELKLLLNKNLLKHLGTINLKKAFMVAVVFVSIILLSSCKKSDEKNEDNKTNIVSLDSAAVHNEIKKLLDDKQKFILKGNYDSDSSKEYASGIEVSEGNNWGIKFILLKVKNNQVQKVFESKLLDGSFSSSVVKKMRFADSRNDVLYYNSQDYFLGSGGGEVFSYIIDFSKNEIYYAHLFSDYQKTPELFLSKNMTNSEQRNFFISNFKNDFPNLKLSSEDVSLDY